MSAIVEYPNTYFQRAQAITANELPDRKWVDQKALDPEVFIEIFPYARIEGRHAKMGGITGNPGSSFDFNLDNGWWEDRNHGDAVNGVYKGKGISRLIEVKNQCSLSEAIEILLAIYTQIGIVIPKKSADIIQLYPLDSEDLERNPLTLKSKHASQEVCRYAYYDVDGSLLGYKVRIQPPGISKQIKPYIYASPSEENPIGGWTCADLPFKSKPLYNLPELYNRPTAKVLFVEGEKTAESAKKLFPDYVAITGWGASGSYDKLDLNPLQGREVTIWADNDAPGFLAQQTLVGMLSERGIQTRCVNIPKHVFPDSWDLADDLPAGVTNMTIRAMLDGADDAMSLDSIAQRLVMVLDSAEFFDLSSGNLYDARRIDMKFSRYVDKISTKLLQVNSIPQVEKTIYNPKYKQYEIIAEKNNRYLNIYTPDNIEPLFEKPEAFLRHLEILFEFEEDKKNFLYFLAHCCQNPGHKLQWVPVLIGRQGMGKSYFGHLMKEIFRNNARSVNGGKLAASEFNGFLEGIHFLTFDEVHSGDEKKEFSNKMKDLITVDRVRINEKNRKEYEAENVVNMLITANDEIPVYFEPSDRRYFILNFHQRQLSNGKLIDHETIKELYPEHFNELFSTEEIQRTYGYLLKLEIPKDWNKNRTAPNTSYKKDMLILTASKLEAQLLEAISDQDTPFTSDFVCLKEVKSWVKENLKGFYNQKKILDALKTCGCVDHGEHELKTGDGKKNLHLLSLPGMDYRDDKENLDLKRAAEQLKRRNVF